MSVAEQTYSPGGEIAPDVAEVAAFLDIVFESTDGGWLTGWLRSSVNTNSFTVWSQNDGNAALDLARQVAPAFGRHNAFYGVATRRERLPNNERGGKTDCVEVPALFADLDIDGPGHAPAPNRRPPKDVLYAWQLLGVGPGADHASAFPLSPSLVVHTGGGLQPLWLFVEPVDVETAEALNARLVDHLGRLAATIGPDGFTFDTQVRDSARVLRLPGSKNMKPGHPVPPHVHVAWPPAGAPIRRYNASDLDDILDPACGPEAEKRARLRPREQLTATDKRNYLYGDSPFARFNRHLGAHVDPFEAMHRATVDVARMLYVRQTSNGSRKYRRPGSENPDNFTLYADDNHLGVYTPNTNLQHHRAYELPHQVLIDVSFPEQDGAKKAARWIDDQPEYNTTSVPTLQHPADRNVDPTTLDNLAFLEWMNRQPRNSTTEHLGDDDGELATVIELPVQPAAVTQQPFEAPTTEAPQAEQPTADEPVDEPTEQPAADPGPIPGRWVHPSHQLATFGFQRSGSLTGNRQDWALPAVLDPTGTTAATTWGVDGPRDTCIFTGVAKDALTAVLPKRHDSAGQPIPAPTEQPLNWAQLFEALIGSDAVKAWTSISGDADLPDNAPATWKTLRAHVQGAGFEESAKPAWRLAAASKARKPQPTPTIMQVAPGKYLLYPNSHNTIYGPSGTGKTWLLALIALDCIRRLSRPVLWLDFEEPDNSQGRWRLEALGATEAELDMLIEFGEPGDEDDDEPFPSLFSKEYGEVVVNDKAAIELAKFVQRENIAAVLIDSFSELAGSQDLDDNQKRDVQRIRKALTKRLARYAAVVMVDHVGNTNSGREAGSVNKKNAVDGTRIYVEQITEITGKQLGASRLWVTKDRRSHVTMWGESGQVQLPGKVTINAHCAGVMSFVPAALNGGTASCEILPPTLATMPTIDGVIARADRPKPGEPKGRSTSTEDVLVEMLVRGDFPSRSQAHIRMKARHGIGKELVDSLLQRLQNDGMVVFENRENGAAKGVYIVPSKVPTTVREAAERERKIGSVGSPTGPAE